MAAILKHGFRIRSPLVLPSIRNCSNIATKDDLAASPKLKDNALSLSCKGFLRSRKPYQPPEGVIQQLLTIGKKVFGPNLDKNARIDNSKEKYNILTECHRVLGHTVPNSELHTIESFRDLVEFYQTPVTTTTPLDDMKVMKLPPNLHVQHDYVRFHPDTDVMFGGISAFPKSSTIVTGLKYRKKYMGYKAKTSWP